MGPDYYGYGFGISMTLTAFIGIIRLSSVMEDIEFQTFMADRRGRQSNKPPKAGEFILED